MTMPGLSGSTPQGGGLTLRCLGEGRLVLVFALGEETGHEYGKPDTPKQFMKCNVIALPDPQSAPSITFGGKMNQLGQMTEPDTHRIDVGPAGTMFENVSIGGGGMLYILRRALKTNTGRVGRLYKDAQYNGAWKLTDIADGSPEMAAAVAWMTAFQSGTFVNPVAMPLPRVPQQAAPAQQNWAAANQQPAQPTAPQQGWGQPPQGAPVNAAPQQQPAQGWGAPQVQQNTVPPAQPGWGAPQTGWGAPQQQAPVPAEQQQPTGF